MSGRRDRFRSARLETDRQNGVMVGALGADLVRA